MQPSDTTSIDHLMARLTAMLTAPALMHSVLGPLPRITRAEYELREAYLQRVVDSSMGALRKHHAALTKYMGTGTHSRKDGFLVCAAAMHDGAPQEMYRPLIELIAAARCLYSLEDRVAYPIAYSELEE